MSASCDFKVGDVVRCVDATGSWGVMPKPGGPHVVSGREHGCIHLVGISGIWDAHRFMLVAPAAPPEDPALAWIRGRYETYSSTGTAREEFDKMLADVWGLRAVAQPGFAFVEVFE